MARDLSMLTGVSGTGLLTPRQNWHPLLLRQGSGADLQRMPRGAATRSDRYPVMLHITDMALTAAKASSPL